MDNCIFCKIINGEISSYKLYEDDYVLAFLDIDPESNGHTLVIPKKHYKDLFDIEKEELNKIIEITKSLSNKLKAKLNFDGFTLVQNNGDIQEVKHFHLHIIPYYNNEQELKSAEDVYKILSN